MSDVGSVLQWIGGRYIDSGTEGVSINPATGEQIGSYADGDAQTAQLAIDAAAEAFATTAWPHAHMLRSACRVQKLCNWSRPGLSSRRSGYCLVLVDQASEHWRAPDPVHGERDDAGASVGARRFRARWALPVW
jgi:hypothetical protein